VEDKAGTIGPPLPQTEVKIVDPQTRATVPPGTIGELCTRGYLVMHGSFDMAKATAEAIDADGWLHTGDLATRTPEGHYRITGRIKDMIIRGGENIYPREIEEFLLTHPKIRDAQVLGLPDERFGEQVSAWIVPEGPGALTEDDVRAFCRERIAHYKIPHYIVFVDEFPLTVTGKVQKFKLRELGIARFDLKSAAEIETA
jgi:fatty-acyl-CoA synthase